MPWITLDLDGTLADWPFREAVFPVMRRYLPQPQAWALRQQEYLRRMGSDDPVSAFDWDSINQVVCAELNLPPLPSISQMIEEAHFKPELLYADTPVAMEKLRADGWKIAVATNGFARYQGAILKRLGLEWDLFLAPDTTGFAKPQAGFWQSIINGEAVVHVGDIVSQDIWGANAAGIKGAWVWRFMPEELESLGVSERLSHPRLGEWLEQEHRTEIDHYGQLQDQTSSALPKPDWVVKDLLELAEILSD
jgi:FMN phosphatase YigB (HAD superfamily)